VAGILPQCALESSIANNFGVGFEHGPQRATILLQIVKDRQKYDAARGDLICGCTRDAPARVFKSWQDHSSTVVSGAIFVSTISLGAKVPGSPRAW
jgi:hypothetical protein